MEHERNARSVAYMVVALLLCGTMLARLTLMQISMGDKFLRQAEGNRLRVTPLSAPRGVIRDRKGRVLATSRLSYSLVLYPSRMPRAKIEALLDRLKGLVTLDKAAAFKKLERAGYASPTPIKLKNDINQRTIAQIAEHQADLPGVAIEPETIRTYPHGKLAAHVIGYTGEVTDGEIERFKGYRAGDIVGKMGLERLHDRELRGVPGSRQVEVDSRGRAGQVLRLVPAKAGKDLRLTIDLDLQRVAEAALDEKKLTGAIVALNPQTGEVLAMASRPAFDPNIFSRKVSGAEWQALQHANFPFVNRALAAYPPGSIFKIPMSVAALESGRASASRRFNSTGSLMVGNRLFHDWTSKGFGSVTIVTALQWSIDTVYYQLGVEMGGNIMSHWAHSLGLGEPTGIGLAGESRGLIPDPAWKRKWYHDRWYPGDSANMSIGQGAVSVTPLQAAVMVSSVANAGKVYTPRIIAAGGAQPLPRKTSTMKPQTLALVRQGLRLVVSSGTGTAADVPGQSISGKSGSAESGKKLTHSWFVCYGPQAHATIAVVAFAEAAGHGGSVAAPVARKVLDQYFGLKSGAIKPAQITD